MTTGKGPAPAGFRTSTADDGTQALAVLACNDYDLVLVQEDFFYPDHIAGALSHPFGSDPQSVVWGTDPTRPDAIVGSGLLAGAVYFRRKREQAD